MVKFSWRDVHYLIFLLGSFFLGFYLLANGFVVGVMFGFTFVALSFEYYISGIYRLLMKRDSAYDLVDSLLPLATIGIISQAIHKVAKEEKTNKRKKGVKK